jgi:hypothetical protein
VVDFVKDSLKLEIDCEKRAVEKIKKHKLSLDIDNYIRRANVYMFSWRYFLDLRCWYHPYYKPYENDELVAIMPTKFLSFNKYWGGHEDIYRFLVKHHKKLLDT